MPKLGAYLNMYPVLAVLVQFWQFWYLYLPQYYLECCSSKYLPKPMKVSKSFDVFGTYVGYFLQYYQSLTFVKAISFFFFFLEDVFVYPPKRS